MTPLQNVYDAFFAKMLEDEWANWTEDELAQDLLEILKGAIPWFKFPRVDLTIEGDSFVGDLNNQEIQILATYMKCEWLNRTILTWENVKPLYEERRHADETQKQVLSQEISTRTAQIKSLRRELRLCAQIEADAERVQTRVHEATLIQKEERYHEPRQRSRRADDARSHPDFRSGGKVQYIRG